METTAGCGMHKGSCLCGAVKFEVDGDLTPPDACHRNQAGYSRSRFEQRRLLRHHGWLAPEAGPGVVIDSLTVLILAAYLILSRKQVAA
jgi:hypothetical protein